MPRTVTFVLFDPASFPERPTRSRLTAAKSSGIAKGSPDGSFAIVELDGERVGRLYLHRRATETRIVDLAIVAERRGQGIGSALLSELATAADAEGRGLSIHVEMFNHGARRLYERFGFRLAEDEGVYLLLARPPAR